ncbi:alpha/beta hydrolase [Piscinibacter sp. HJYY11]|uniref:alpha/beta hydrolase n=1 Tax=Piscinibacter sp. HJYY11 TaxID=2801333 RepID=UPI00191F9A27|nr:alpha/beta fold hydrolase [Piscinibacter sp. HJYY11]MBL0728826.1 alpha/beta fold hydrolase [Piscinibacter sp. HJYY11]
MNDTTLTVDPAVERAALAFLTPSPQAKAPSLDFMPGARRRLIDSPSGPLAAAEWGEGPAVLLMHGWDGKASDLAAFAPALLAAGHKVIAVNLPAHGESAGERTSIPGSARAFVAAQEALGPLRAVVAHSIATAVTVEAVALGLPAQRLALISAPARYAMYAKGFAAQAGLSPEQAEQMLEALRAMGVDVHSISTPRRAAALKQPVLFVHSADDRVVPIADAEASHAKWAGPAQFLRLDGLGHRRLLQSPEVVAAVTAFVTAP